jgi:hypothetical protein
MQAKWTGRNQVKTEGRGGGKDVPEKRVSEKGVIKFLIKFLIDECGRVKLPMSEIPRSISRRRLEVRHPRKGVSNQSPGW